MMEMNKKYMKIAVYAAIAIGGYLVIKNLLRKSAVTSIDSPTPNEPSKIVTQDFPIKKGSKGDKVKEIQKLLIEIDINALPKYGIDGDFGTETEVALFKYLKKKSIDNQEDLTNLIGLKDASKASTLQTTIDANRQVSANQIINDWKNNTSKSIYAKNETQYSMGVLSFNGAETNLSTKVAKTGNKIVNGFEIKNITILPSGFLKIITTAGLNGGFIKVSPFAVLIK